MRRNLALAVATMLVLVTMSLPAWAFPDRPITFIVPTSTGGGTDTLARLVAQGLGEAWNQTVIVENRPGGNGAIAGQSLLNADPDGHTLLFAAGGHITINPLLQDLPYDPRKEFEPVSILATAPYVLVVNPDLVPSRSVREFIDFARERPGQVAWGTSRGSPDQLAGELFQMMTDVKLNHIPYFGGGDALVDIVGGRVEAGFLTVPATLSYIEAGQLRPLGVSGTSRSALLPDVPPIAEADLDGYSMVTWYGLFAPGGTPQDIVDQIASAVSEVLQDQEIQKQLTTRGFEALGYESTRAEQFIADEAEKFRKIVEATGLDQQK